MLPKLLPTATYGAVVPKQAIENIHLDDPSRQGVAMFDVLGLAT